VKNDNNYKKVLSKTLNLLSKKNYSEHELREKLNLYDNQIVEKVITKLKESNLIDDKKYAENIVEKSLKKGKGLYYIINILRKKGIDENIINQIKENFDFGQEYKVVQSLINKIKRKKGYKSLFLFLKSRGFSTETINKLMEKYGE